MDFAPDDLGQLQNGGARSSRKIEVMVDGSRMFQANSYSLSQIATVRVVPDLISRTENVEGILALEYLLRQIGYHMRQCPLLSYADAIERTHDGIRQPVLLPRTLNKILGCQLLKSVGGTRRGAAVLRALRGGILRSTLEHHAGRHHGYLLQLLVLMSIDRGIERGSSDTFILRQQVVGELVKVADAADHRGRGHKVIDVG